MLRVWWTSQEVSFEVKIPKCAFPIVFRLFQEVCRTMRLSESGTGSLTLSRESNATTSAASRRWKSGTWAVQMMQPWFWTRIFRLLTTAHNVSINKPRPYQSVFTMSHLCRHQRSQMSDVCTRLGWQQNFVGHASAAARLVHPSAT